MSKRDFLYIGGELLYRKRTRRTGNLSAGYMVVDGRRTKKTGPEKKMMSFIKDNSAGPSAVLQFPQKTLNAPASMVSKNDIDLMRCMSIGPSGDRQVRFVTLVDQVVEKGSKRHEYDIGGI